jgi:hypothetical protein
MNVLRILREKAGERVDTATLAFFRIVFGLLMLASTARFLLNGWVDQLYIKPGFFFSYYGFEWVKPLPGPGMYIVFGLLLLCFLLLTLGLFYRVAAVLSFLLFTYTELIDKTNYLNHYYFVSLVLFLLCFVPASSAFSLDVLRNPRMARATVPAWTVFIFKLQFGIVYFYAGLAKLNPDWMLRAMPLRIWLPPHADFPVLGYFFTLEWVAYAFSWIAALYDLSIFFLLSYSRTRTFAYVLVLVFHILTALLFPIGMFPYIMMASTLIFFPAARIRSWLETAGKWAGVTGRNSGGLIEKESPRYVLSRFSLLLLSVFFLLQLALPMRYLLYPGHLFWTEQGYRFSWRVMLMEKAGTAFFYVKDARTGRESEVQNSMFLTPHQEKMMATQPDMIVQFAHFLRSAYSGMGYQDPSVRVESYVTLNGSGSRLFINPATDLTEERESFAHKSWLMPFAGDTAHPVSGNNR